MLFSYGPTLLEDYVSLYVPLNFEKKWFRFFGSLLQVIKGTTFS